MVFGHLRKKGRQNSECREYRRKKSVKERAFASYIFKFGNMYLYINGVIHFLLFYSSS